CAHPDQGGDSDDEIDRFVPPYGGDHPKDNARDQADHDSCCRQFHGRRKVLGQLLCDRAMSADRGPQIAVQQVIHVGQVLNVNRFVQPPLVAKGSDDLWICGGALTQIGCGRIGGYGMGYQECHQ
ncbi:MAG: hypothetical protein DRJ64_07060, partial [Thermoprotei archaeon]